MNFKNLSLIVLVSSSFSWAMQQSSTDHVALYNQKKSELKDLVTSGNNTLKAIANAGVMSEQDAQALTQVANDVDTSASVLDDLISKIKATHASNTNDPKAKQIAEDVAGDVLDVLEETPKILPLVLQIIEQAKDANHPANKYHQSVVAAKAKVAKK